MLALLLILAVVNILCFAYSIIGVFKNVDSKNNIKYRVLQISSLIAYGSTVATYYHANVESEVMYISLAMLIASFSLFWWSANTIKKSKLSIVYSKDTPLMIITEGPFKFMRHPFYLSYVLTYFSALVINYNHWHLLSCVLITLVYLDAIVFEEKKFANSSLASKYIEYKARTGVFFPKLWKTK